MDNSEHTEELAEEREQELLGLIDVVTELVRERSYKRKFTMDRIEELRREEPEQLARIRDLEEQIANKRRQLEEQLNEERRLEAALAERDDRKQK